MSPSGGVVYHATALRRQSAWAPFREKVREWIVGEWLARRSLTKELVVFGPSAGWTLDASIFARFECVTLVEPDPFARFLFKRRFSRDTLRATEFRFEARADLLPWFAKPFGSSESLTEFLSKRDSAALLFANVLGQVPLLIPSLTDRDHEIASRSLLETLRGREWASYHDLFSSRTMPDLRSYAAGGLEASHEGWQSLALAETLFPSGSEVFDHMTAWLSRDRTTKLTHWELRPGQSHVVGFVVDESR